MYLALGFFPSILSFNSPICVVTDSANIENGWVPFDFYRHAVYMVKAVPESIEADVVSL